MRATGYRSRDAAPRASYSARRRDSAAAGVHPKARVRFGVSTHWLPACMLGTPLSCLLLPDVLLLAFEDVATGTSGVRFIRQGAALDLRKLVRDP